MNQFKILIIGLNWPEPKTTAAGRRMLQLITLFLEFNSEIIFACTAQKTEYSEDLERLAVRSVPILLNDPSFDSFIKDLEPEIVLFDRFITEEQFGWRVAKFAPAALRVLDTEDLHSLRASRALALKTENPFSPEHWRANDLTKRELASIYRSDLSLIISEAEMKLLQKTFPLNESHLFYLPLFYDVNFEAHSKGWSGYDDRKGFVCIGSGKHAPNVDGIRWLRSDIWPLIRKAIPDAEVWVYGAYFSNEIEKLQDTELGFHVSGWTDDLETSFSQARLLLAPLRFGAGLKGKLLDAMFYGTPSITTTVGGEGIAGTLSWPGSKAETPEAFARVATDLYLHKEEWSKAQQQGRQVLEKRFAKESFKTQFFEVLKAMRKDLRSHRNSNFIGSMLLHHTLASHKYLSKWIEEKNAKR